MISVHGARLFSLQPDDPAALTVLQMIQDGRAARSLINNQKGTVNKIRAYASGRRRGSVVRSGVVQSKGDV